VHGAPALAPGERLDDLEEALAPQLDAGGAPSGALVDRLPAPAARFGCRVRIEQPAMRGCWRTRGAWPLRHEVERDHAYRPAATPADFLDRFLASFEAMLTPLEDRVAAAHLRPIPRALRKTVSTGWARGSALRSIRPCRPRTASTGCRPRRKLARLHGSRRARAALDLASGGGVSGGEIIVLEDFRLRRLLATLLGVDLGVEDDPLLPGLIVSGNSVVGDTLVLGEAERVELLALFREEVATERENQAVLAFYERLAH
jgi:hypothetical protein